MIQHFKSFKGVKIGWDSPTTSNDLILKDG